MQFHTFKRDKRLKNRSKAKDRGIYITPAQTTDYGRPERKQPSLHGRKFTPTPKFLGTAVEYFVCHTGPIFQISLIYVFIGCPQSVVQTHQTTIRCIAASRKIKLRLILSNRTSNLKLMIRKILKKIAFLVFKSYQ